MTDRSEWTTAADERTPPSTVASELERLVLAADDLAGGDPVTHAVRWAGATVDAGTPATAVCDAARLLGSGVSERTILAAPACTTLAALGLVDEELDRATARLAAVQLVAWAAADRVASAQEPAAVATSRTDDRAADETFVHDPFHTYLDAALLADTARADAAWVAAARTEPVLAAQVLVSAGVATYHLDEARLLLAAQAGAWPRGDASCARSLRAVARRLAEAPQDPDHASMRRADAAVLAADAVERSPETFGRLPRASHERLSILATGVSLTSPDALPSLLLASLEDGLSPEDLADAIALLRAAALAITELGDDASRTARAVLACGGADAVQRCMAGAHSAELRYELALCATEGPAAAALEPVAELWVPPFDDGALGDLVVALDEVDADAAAEAATAVPPDDADSTAAAWRAVRAAAVRGPQPSPGAITHVVAMERGFRCSAHPARIWFLAAAARIAGAVVDDGSAGASTASTASKLLGRPS